MKPDNILTRRSFLTLGLGLGGALLASPPSAFAKASLYTTSDGYDEAGNAIDGLVTIGDKTYGYKAGEMQKGVCELQGERYFYLTDGHMAKSESIEVSSGNYNTYGADGIKTGSFKVPTSGSGWVKQDDKLYYFENNKRHTGWLVVDTAPDGTKNNKQRYYCDKTTGAVQTDYYKVDGILYYGIPGKYYVVRGAYQIDSQHVLVADNDGKLIDNISDKEGWLVTDKMYAKGHEMAGLRRYRLENRKEYGNHARVRIGWFELDGHKYCGRPDYGCVAHSTTMVDPMRPNKDQWGSIYDFNADGHASWHVPVPSDVVYGGAVAIPEQIGDKRQRFIRNALSRIGLPYGMASDYTASIPDKMVCDQLASWSYWATIGQALAQEWIGVWITADDKVNSNVIYQFNTRIKGNGTYCENRADLKPGDVIVEDSGNILGTEDISRQYHVAIYCGNGMVVEEQSLGRTDWQGNWVNHCTYCTLDQSVNRWGFTAHGCFFSSADEEVSQRQVALPVG